MPDLFYLIKTQPYWKTKKEHVMDGIKDAISQDILQKGHPLPSINQFVRRLGYSHMTVVKSLNLLKEEGIITSVDKVGYFVKDVNVNRKLKVFLFLAGFDFHLETLYNSIIQETNKYDITIDLFFHHFNPKVFKSILREHAGSYGLYVISGFENEVVRTELSHLPLHKTLQITRPPLLEDVPYICQDFSFGLRDALISVKDRILNYRKFILVFPPSNIHSSSIRSTFESFCTENRIPFVIEETVQDHWDIKDNAYWVIDDRDLLKLIKNGMNRGLQPGTDYGLLSYNETTMKEIICQGITVVSVDFNKMGKLIADFMIRREPVTEVLAPTIIMRKSL